MSKNRPMLNLDTNTLVARIFAGDVAAAREATIRLARGVRKDNARKLRNALSDVLVDDIRDTPAPAPIPAPAPALPEGITPEIVAQVLALVNQASTPDPTPAPAPEPAPAKRDFRAANAFAKRVSKLQAAKRVALVAQAKELAMAEGWTPENVDALSDEDVLGLLNA